MITQEELQEILDIVESISLNFSQPETLNTQIKAIGIAQKKLKVFRKKIVKTIQEINQSASQASADDAVTVLSDFLGNRKFAGQMRASNRRAIQRSKQATRQPFLNLKDTIDATIIKCDEMKLMVEEYNSDPEVFLAKMKEKQEQEALKLLRKQEEEERLRLLKEEENRKLMLEKEAERKKLEEESKKPSVVFQSAFILTLIFTVICGIIFMIMDGVFSLSVFFSTIIGCFIFSAIVASFFALRTYEENRKEAKLIKLMKEKEVSQGMFINCYKCQSENLLRLSSGKIICNNCKTVQK